MAATFPWSDWNLTPFQKQLVSTNEMVLEGMRPELRLWSEAVGVARLARKGDCDNVREAVRRFKAGEPDMMLVRAIEWVKGVDHEYLIGLAVSQVGQMLDNYWDSLKYTMPSLTKHQSLWIQVDRDELQDLLYLLREAGLKTERIDFLLQTLDDTVTKRKMRVFPLWDIDVLIADDQSGYWVKQLAWREQVGCGLPDEWWAPVEEGVAMSLEEVLATA